MLKKVSVLPSIHNLGKSLKDKTVLVRVDFNVPIKNGKVVNGYRIVQSLPTIDYLVKAGAKVILITHLADHRQSAKPAATFLNQYIKAEFAPTWPSQAKRAKLKKGSVLVLQNLRYYAGEEKNNLSFAKSLADLGDIYVNDAFSASHRRHASIVSLPRFLPTYAGLLFVKEYVNLSKIFSPGRPFLLILGGAKFQTKIPLVRRYLNQADDIFIVGALAHIFYRQMGFETGRSLIDEDMSGLSAILKNKKVHLPIDVVVKTPTGRKVKRPEAVGRQDVIYDAGPETIKSLSQSVKAARVILWNGPLGNFEKSYDQGTKALARAIASSRGYAVVGGGDTVAAIDELKLNSKFGFVSTAGGAMLDFLVTGTLPGIKALKQKK